VCCVGVASAPWGGFPPLSAGCQPVAVLVSAVCSCSFLPCRLVRALRVFVYRFLSASLVRLLYAVFAHCSSAFGLPCSPVLALSCLFYSLSAALSSSVSYGCFTFSDSASSYVSVCFIMVRPSVSWSALPPPASGWMACCWRRRASLSVPASSVYFSRLPRSSVVRSSSVGAVRFIAFHLVL